jgi:hypothetical protein
MRIDTDWEKCNARLGQRWLRVPMRAPRRSVAVTKQRTRETYRIVGLVTSVSNTTVPPHRC